VQVKDIVRQLLTRDPVTRLKVEGLVALLGKRLSKPVDSSSIHDVSLLQPDSTGVSMFMSNQSLKHSSGDTRSLVPSTLKEMSQMLHKVDLASSFMEVSRHTISVTQLLDSLCVLP
jgi:hypothetical protein